MTQERWLELMRNTFWRMTLVFFRSLKRVVSEEAEEELAPHKLPGELNDWTGNVLYPDEESRKWDVNG